jgi:hypothetical protein
LQEPCSDNLIKLNRRISKKREERETPEKRGSPRVSFQGLSDCRGEGVARSSVGLITECLSRSSLIERVKIFQPCTVKVRNGEGEGVALEDPCRFISSQSGRSGKPT